jgi:hypothetical protein
MVPTKETDTPIGKRAGRGRISAPSWRSPRRVRSCAADAETRSVRRRSCSLATAADDHQLALDAVERGDAR